MLGIGGSCGAFVVFEWVLMVIVGEGRGGRGGQGFT